MVNKPFGDIITFSRASGGGMFNSSGVYEWVGNNVPRFDHDPITGAPLGILIEEQRTNLLTYSNDLTNPAWSQERGSWTNSPDTRFDTVGTLTEDLTTGTRITTRAISLTSGVTYTHTERLKAVGRDRIRLQIFQVPAVAADFDLLAGTVSNITGGSASIKPLGDGWYDCSVTLSVTTTQSHAVRFYPIVSGSVSYLGDGREVIKHAGAQLEAGEFPTSYIPTVASQVTRDGDRAFVADLLPWYNPKEGTLLVDTVYTTTGQAFTFAASIGVELAPFSRVSVGKNLSNLSLGQVVDGTGAVQASIYLSPGVTINSRAIQALAYKEDDFQLATNGVASPIDSSGTVPTPSRLAIGARGTTVDTFTGYIRAIRYYPRRLSASELQDITAL